MRSSRVECWGSAARLSEEESRSVLLEKYVRKRLRESLCGLLIYPGKIIRIVWLKSSSLDENIKIETSTAKIIPVLNDITSLLRNWGKHKNTRFYLIWGSWIQIWKSVFTHHLYFFLYMHSVHFVHIRYIKAYMNSGLILILWDLWLIS